jgi:hypothetical protein
LCGKGLEALVGLEWDGHELFSLDIVGNQKMMKAWFGWCDCLKGAGERAFRKGKVA